MSIENHLAFLKKETDKITDDNSRALILSRIESHLVKYEGDDRMVFSSDIDADLKDKPLPIPIPTAHSSLDNIIKGFYPGQHIIFSAPPKSGKTSFILDLIARMSDSKPTLLPLEQSAEELISIMQERNLDVPNFIAPRTNKRATISWVEERITEAVVKYNSRVIFLDHFGYVLPDSKEDHHLQITDTMQRLKSIAKQLNISIVSIVHVRKVDPTQPPTVEDLYGSAGFLQEADTIVMLWREAYKEERETKWSNKVLVSVQANRRNGDTGSFRMKYVDFKFIEDPNIEFEYENQGASSGFGVYDK